MTAAHHAGFLTRAQLALQPPRSVSYNVRPERGGVALHHGGENVPIASHAGCADTWRSWQRYHLGPNAQPPAPGHGWADIAYSLGVCQHGWVLAGRGYGVRTAAQGTNDGNDRYLAVCWLGGARQTPTPDALAAITWAVGELRRLGAGTEVRGHRDINPSTACPHDRLIRLARELHRRPITTTPLQEDDEMTPEQARKLDEVHAYLAPGRREDGTVVVRGTERHASWHLRRIETLAALTAGRVRELGGSLTDEQLDDLADAIAASVNERDADELLDRLAARIRSR